nr:retrovirus-related Pol polyprotein from transposon TNT 1-94 [Tanacetum cinerariifolium]
FSSLETGLVVPVFQKGDDLIDAINHMMSFLTSVFASRYPPTNNQLRTSSNPRQQATINNERVTIQPIQERQNHMLTGASRPFVSGSGGTYGKQRVIVCYNCKGKGHMSKQYTKPKRKRDAEWFKDKGRGLQVTQNVKDTHVTLTPVNPDGPQKSSSMSSFVSSMLNPISDVGVESIFTTTSSPIVSLETPTPIMTPSTIATITTSGEAPIPPPTIPSIILENLPTFNSAFRFEERLRSLETSFSEYRQTNQFADAVSAILGILHQYMDQQMKEAVQIQIDRLQDSLQRENDEFLRNIDENMKKVLKGLVKNQVKEQVSRILPRIKESVNATLEAEVLTRSSHSSRTSYAIAADLSEMELKKILIEKMEGNKSIQRSDEQRNLYKALVEAYEADKAILDTYGDSTILKRRREDDDQEGPSAGPNRRLSNVEISSLLYMYVFDDQMPLPIIVTCAWTMATTIKQQVALDETLVPSTKRLRIGRSNFRFPSDIQSKDSTLQVVYDVLRRCPFFQAFLVTADEKVLVITALKEQLDKLKGKAVITEAVSLNPIDPELLKVDVTPVVLKLRKNRMAHIDYIRYTQGEVATIRKIVESERLLSPLNTSLDYACCPNSPLVLGLRALCYPTNDSENLGKLQPKADIGIFIGYAPTKKAFRIYNRRTIRIVETIHVDFDELTAMTSKQRSSGPALYDMTPGTISSGLVQKSSPSASYVPPSRNDWDLLFQPLSGPALNEMTPGTISSGLVQKSSPSASYVPPSRNDWDLLFQPLFDELLNPPPSVVNQAVEVIAPIAEVIC